MEVHVGLHVHVLSLIFVHVTCRSGLLWRRCDTLCFRFMDDVIFARNGPYGGMSILLQPVTSLRRRAQANAPHTLH